MVIQCFWSTVLQDSSVRMVLPCALQMSDTWWVLSSCCSLGLAKADLEMLQNELIWNYVCKSCKLIYNLHPNCSKFLRWGWIPKAETEEDIKHVQICCIYKEVVGKRWKFTLNQRWGHEDKALWSGTEKVRQESFSTLWNQESSTTDHPIGGRQLVSPSKDGKTHIHTPVAAYACWEESFPPPRRDCSLAGLQRRSSTPSYPALLPLLLQYLHCFGGFTGLSYPDAIYFAKRWR